MYINDIMEKMHEFALISLKKETKQMTEMWIEKIILIFHATDDSDVEDLLQKTGNYLVTSSALPQGLIDLKQCADANKEQPSEV